MKKYKADNLGFSLVEIIIVVAIMSVLIGVTGYGLSLSSGKPAEECARKLTAALQHGRTTTMGKYRNIITISKEHGTGRIVVTEDILIKINDDNTEQKSTRSSVVGSKGVTFKYSKDGGASFTELLEGEKIELRFDSGSGALRKATTPEGLEYYYSVFEISKAGKVKYVVIQPLTGRITVEETATALTPP